MVSSDMLTEVLWKTANYMRIHALNFSVWDSHSSRVLVLVFLLSFYAILNICSFPTHYFGRYFEIWIDLCTPVLSPGVKNPITFFGPSKSAGLFCWKVTQISVFIYMRYAYTSMRSIWGIFIFVSVSLMTVFIYKSEDANNCKCSHHFCESKTGGWIKCSKDWYWIGDPSISFCHETKIIRNIRVENHESISSCLKNSWLNGWKFENSLCQLKLFSPLLDMILEFHLWAKENDWFGLCFFLYSSVEQW